MVKFPTSTSDSRGPRPRQERQAPMECRFGRGGRVMRCWMGGGKGNMKDEYERIKVSCRANNRTVRRDAGQG